jgi:rubrerythrin
MLDALEVKMNDTPEKPKESEKAVCLNCNYTGKATDFSAPKGAMVCPFCGASAVKPVS